MSKLGVYMMKLLLILLLFFNIGYATETPPVFYNSQGYLNEFKTGDVLLTDSIKVTNTAEVGDLTATNAISSTTIYASQSISSPLIYGSLATTVDISDDTNLAVDSPIVLTDDTLSLDVSEFVTGTDLDAYVLKAGDTMTGNLITTGLESSGAVTATTLIVSESISGPFELDRVEGSTPASFTKLRDFITTNASTGVVSGGLMSDNGDGTIKIAAGSGSIRDSSDPFGKMYFTTWPENSSVSLEQDVLAYVYMQYNGPLTDSSVVTSTTELSDVYSNIYLGTAFRNSVKVHTGSALAYNVNDTPVRVIKRLQSLEPFARASGGVTSETGTRNIAITAGVFWEGTNEVTTAAFDSSGSDTFIAEYQDGASGYTQVAAQTQIDNLQYDDGSGTLAALSANRYGVHWVYLELDGDVIALYGRGNYTLPQAQDADPPADIPDHYEKHSRLIAKIIIKQAASTFTSIENPFTAQFTPSVATNHSDLLGLTTGDDHTQYVLVDGTRAMDKLTVSGSATATTFYASTHVSSPNIHASSTLQVGSGTPTDPDEFHVYGAQRIIHSSTEADDHALEIDLFANGFGDVKAIDIDYVTGAIEAGEDEEVILINIDETAATGGRVAAIEVVSTTESGIKEEALFVGVGIDPIEHLSGTFGDATSISDNGVDVLTALSGGGAGNISIFEADNETLTIGLGAKFEEIEVILDTGASGAGISPTYEYSTGVGTWGSFTPTDGTNQFKNTGVIVWLDSDIPTWAPGTGSEYLVRITRTRNSLGTTPIVDKIQVTTANEYYWNKSANLLVNNISNVNLTASGEVSVTGDHYVTGISTVGGLTTSGIVTATTRTSTGSLCDENGANCVDPANLYDTADDSYVLVAGDTMTGALTVTNSSTIQANDGAGNYTNQTYFGTRFNRSTSYIDQYAVGGDIWFRTSESTNNDTTAMVILDNGNVGIGPDTSPDVELHVNDSDNAEIRIESTGTDTDAILVHKTEDYSMSTYIDDSDVGKMKWYSSTYGGVMMNLTHDASLGIRNSTPAAPLHITTSSPTSATLIIEGGAGTAVDGSQMAALQFGSNDGSVNNTNNIGAQILMESGTSNGAGQELAFYTFQQSASPDLAEHMRIDYLGNVGIGNSSPAQPLHVTGVTRTDGDLQISDTTPRMWLYSEGQVNAWEFFANISDSVNSQFQIENNNNIRFVIDSAGDVGVGDDTSPDNELHINKTADHAVLEIEADGDGNYSAIQFTRERLSGTGQGGGVIRVASDTSTNNSVLEIMAETSVVHSTADTRSMIRLRGSSEGGTEFANLDTYAVGKDYRMDFVLNDDGDNDTDYARIQTEVIDGTDTSEDGELRFYTMQAGTLTQQMTIDENGDVGINTASPSGLLHVNADGSGNEFYYSRSDSTVFSINADGFNTNIATTNDFIVDTGTALGALFVEDNTGNVGLSTETPDAKLHVYENNTTVSGNGAKVEQDGTGDAATRYLMTGVQWWSTGVDNSDSDKFKISPNADLASSPAITIQTDGNVGIGDETPGATFSMNVSNTTDYDPDAMGYSIQSMQMLNEGSDNSAMVGISMGHSNAGNNGYSIIASVVEGDNDFGAIVFGNRETSFTDGRENMRITHDGFVGIGERDPVAELEIQASANPEIRISEGGVSGDYTLIQDTQPTQMVFEKHVASGSSLIDINPRPGDGTSTASFRFFRATNTSNTVDMAWFQGDGSSTFNARMYTQANGNTYFVHNGGNVGIAEQSPDAKLEISLDGVTEDAFHVSSDDANDGDLFIVDSTTNVGIGVTDPAAKLEVTGDIMLTESNAATRTLGILTGADGDHGGHLLVHSGDGYGTPSSNDNDGGNLTIRAGDGFYDGGIGGAQGGHVYISSGDGDSLGLSGNIYLTPGTNIGALDGKIIMNPDGDQYKYTQVGAFATEGDYNMSISDDTTTSSISGLGGAIDAGLHVNGTGYTGLLIEGTTGVQLDLYDNGEGEMGTLYAEAGFFKFATRFSSGTIKTDDIMTIDTSSGNIGFNDSSPDTRMSVGGNYATLPGTSFTLTADNTNIGNSGDSFFLFGSNSSTVADRTFFLQAGLVAGQILRMCFEGTGRAQLQDNAANSDSGNVRLNANWAPDDHDCLTLIFSGTDWYETARSAN